MTEKIVWTAEIDAILIRLWNEGGSLRYVAAEMNRLGYPVTRNAIAGRRHRMPKYSFERDAGSYAAITISAAKPKVLKPRKPKKPKPINDQGSNIMPFPETISTAGTVDHDDGVEYLLNSENGCKALLDARGSDGLPKCCGRPRGLDYRGSKSSYCQMHYRQFHHNPNVRSANG